MSSDWFSLAMQMLANYGKTGKSNKISFFNWKSLISSKD